ncbi:TonB-dependent receptor domain-containing protein [Phenylobacterium sp.]|uniref:TonB-dependent receptor n=1 Tax=Phenylobacterium sp. TaxID=1871053 RepID=UPI00286C930E|nr:TonB-dependent receptor [Phenylobacterium sp.]
MLLGLAGRAEAAEARSHFEIAPKPYAEALIDLAVQADVSLLGASACGEGGKTSLSGAYRLSDALARLLAGAPCAWRIVDARTVRVTPLAAPSRILAPGAPLVTELLVTARKRPERLDTLPAGVSVISGDQLRATGAGDARDTAGQLVGLLMTNLGPGRDKLLIRGLSDGAFTGRARSTVSTYLDDTPTNYNAPDPDLKLADIERVETVRGPQGALYGSGALAGVYRIVANKPDPGRYAGGLQAVVASTAGGAPSREADGYLNIPLVKDRAALRLVGYYDLQGGYLDNVALRLSNVDSTSRQGGRIALRMTLNDRWTIDAAGVVQRLRSQDTHYTTVTVGRGRRASQVREASANDFSEAAVTVRGALGGADLAATTSYVQHTYASLYDATAAAAAFSETGASLAVYSETAHIRRLVQDVVLTSSGGGPVGWLVGAYASSSVERTPSSLDIQAGAAAAPAALALTRVYNEARRDKLRELAAYGEATWRFAPGWTAALGARVFQTGLKVNADIVGAPPAQSRAVSESRTFTGVLPKISLQYQFAEGTLVYGIFTQGFRPGGINSTGFLTIRPSRTTFEPDQLRNFEIGAKGRFLDRRLVVRAAAFYDLWSNIQSDQYRLSGLAYTANVGDARIGGLEAEIAYDWDFGLSVQANALYSASRFTRANPDFANTLASGLPGAPPTSGGLLVRYERPLRGHLVLSLVGEANYVGRTRLTFDPAQSSKTDAVVNAELLAEIAGQHWTAGVFISNPTDAAGNTFAYGNPFTVGQVRQVTPQRPRTIGLRLSAAF